MIMKERLTHTGEHRKAGQPLIGTLDVWRLMASAFPLIFVLAAPVLLVLGVAVIRSNRDARDTITNILTICTKPHRKNLVLHRICQVWCSRTREAM